MGTQEFLHLFQVILQEVIMSRIKIHSDIVGFSGFAVKLLKLW